MRWWPKEINHFMSDKSASHDKNKILQEDDKIITNTREICEIFYTYFTTVASNIGFDDSIPPDFDTEYGFSNMINKHCRHPSILKIRENISRDSFCLWFSVYTCIGYYANYQRFRCQESSRLRYGAYEVVTEIRTTHSTLYCETGKKKLHYQRCFFRWFEAHRGVSFIQKERSLE